MFVKKTKNVVATVSIILLEVALIALVIYNREKISSILQPILIGLIIAYIINPLMIFIEKWLKVFFQKCFKWKNKVVATASRVISILVSLGLVWFVIAFIFSMLIPEIIKSVTQLSTTLPDLIRDEIGKLPARFNISDIYDTVIENVSTSLVSLVSSLSSNLANMVISVATLIKDVLIGFIITIYVLFSKETLLAQCKKIINGIFRKESTVLSINEGLSETNRIFKAFFIGKILDSVIVGIICFIAMMILGLPYAVLISVIIAITNVIPFFGPFIGGIPCALFIVLNDFWSGVYFVVIIVVLHIFDGYVLEPRILGSSTGLSPLWVMIAILVFGGLFGFMGMLFGVPILAVISMLFKRFINQRIAQKGEQTTIDTKQ